MKRTLFILLLAFVLPALSAEKDKAVSYHLLVLQKLQQIARNNRDGEIRNQEPRVCAEIDRLLPDTLTSDQLYKVGISAHLIAYPQSAEDIFYDWAFDYASHRCGKILSTRADADSGHYLRLMKAVCGTDGGESLIYRGWIEQQEQLQKKAKRK
jgi:hypothetical protein